MAAAEINSAIIIQDYIYLFLKPNGHFEPRYHLYLLSQVTIAAYQPQGRDSRAAAPTASASSPQTHQGVSAIPQLMDHARPQQPYRNRSSSCRHCQPRLPAPTRCPRRLPSRLEEMAHPGNWAEIGVVDSGPDREQTERCAGDPVAK